MLHDQKAAHSPTPEAIGYSFGAFITTVVLVFAVISFIDGRKK